MVYARTRTDFGGLIDFDRMMDERRERAKKAMAKYDLDALLLFRLENCRYVVGTRPHPGYQYVLYPIKADTPVYHWAGMNAKNLAGAGIRGLDARYTISLPEQIISSNLPAFNYQLGKFVAQIKQELKEHGILGGKIGIDMANHLVIDALQKEGITISTDGRHAMDEARIQKTKDEIECLRIACSIAEGCFQRAKELIRPGVTEQQVYAEMQKTAFELGAESWDGGNVLSGPHSFPPCNCVTDRIMRPGDIVLIDISNLSYHGYKTCYYRNFSVGEPTNAQREAWDKAKDFMWEAVKLLKPGVSTRDLVEKWPKAEEFGFENEDDACFCQWSHGIGLTHYEAPIFSRIWDFDYPEELKEGMACALETLWPTNERTAAYPMGQCLRIEEEVVITKNGYDMLSQWPTDEITVCW